MSWSNVDSPDPQRPRGKARPVAKGPGEEAQQPAPTHQADHRGSYSAAVSPFFRNCHRSWELILSSDDINKKQVDRLEQAVEARDNIERMIREKLVDLQREGRSLVAVLDSGYQYRLEKAKSLVSPVSEQRLAPGEGRPVKKVKTGASSS